MVAILITMSQQGGSVRTYVRTYTCTNTQRRVQSTSAILQFHGTMVQALVRVQAHMLARIVVEIRAADIAVVELEPQL